MMAATPNPKASRRGRKISGNRPYCLQPQKGQLLMLIGIFLRFNISWYLSISACTTVTMFLSQGPATSVRKYDIRAIALQTLESQDGRFPYERLLLLLDYWRLWMFIPLLLCVPETIIPAKIPVYPEDCFDEVSSVLFLCQSSAASCTLSVSFLHSLHKGNSAVLSIGVLYRICP